MKTFPLYISLIFCLTACGDPTFHKRDNVITITEVVEIEHEPESESAPEPEVKPEEQQLDAAAKAEEAPKQYVTVKGERQQLRTGPDREKDPVYKPDGSNAKCPEDGAKLELLGESGNYYKVRFDGRELYINKQSCI